MLTASNVPDVDDIGTSATSLLIAVASKTFTTQANLPFLAGEWLLAYSTATPANYMYGKVTSYTGTTLIINVSVNGGAGTLADWKISYGWNVAAAYLDGDQVQLSTVNNHKIYEALENVTGGTSPELDVLLAAPKWLEISATNRWKAFDTSVGSQTSKATSITYTITPGEVFDSIGFLNLSATAVQFTLTDPVDGVIYTETVELLDVIITGTQPIIDWYAYFFSAIMMTTAFARPGISLYLNTVLTITISYAGGTAAVGAIIIGTQMTIGGTQYGAGVGIRDYSVKGADAFGNPVITTRAYSKRMSCELTVPTNSIADIQNTLARYRTTLLLWVGVDDYASTIIYGFYRDFNIVLSYPAFAICSIEIEGMT